MPLSVVDIERWNAAGHRAQVTQNVSRELSTPSVFDTWSGEAAEAARHAVAITRRDFDAHGNDAAVVANAASKAADGIEKVQAGLRSVKAGAESHGLEVDSASNRIVRLPHSRRTDGTRAATAC